MAAVMAISDQKIVSQQMKACKNTVAFALLLVIVITAGGCVQVEGDGGQTPIALPHFNTPDFTPQWFSTSEAEAANMHSIAPFAFTNQNGATVDNSTFAGKVYVADFFFTSCGSICPKMTRNMASLQEAFADESDLLLLSHSVTPEADSVPRLKQYAESMGVNDAQWHLVTGEQDEIYALARKSYFAEERMGYDKDVEAFLHTENFILVDRNGHIRGIYNGTLGVEMNRLTEDIGVLLAE
jgi:protein SCO1/2